MFTEGYLDTPAGELFYRCAGSIAQTPLVCVHGGPGFTSYTLEPLLNLSDTCPVICYDQAGCGRARRAGPRRLFSIDGFIAELEALRAALHLDRMHLLGHSFGALVVGEYALRNPTRVASAIFSSASIDIPLWIKDAERLVSQMSLRDKMILKEGLRTGAMNSPEFLRALDVYYAKHVNGFTEMPECIRLSISEGDSQSYQIIWGANELIPTGYIKDYSLTPRLCELTCRAMFMCGRFDEATPEAHALFASLVPGSRYHVFEQSAHNTVVTEEAEVLRVVRDFIEDISSGERLAG